MSAIIVYMTASNKDEARSIARELLSKRIIACANIFDGVTSLYEWNGSVCEDGEAVIILKTKKSLFEVVKSEILKLHSYENPSILAFDVTGGSEKFLSWIESQTKL